MLFFCVVFSICCFASSFCVFDCHELKKDLTTNEQKIRAKQDLLERYSCRTNSTKKHSKCDKLYKGLDCLKYEEAILRIRASAICPNSIKCPDKSPYDKRGAGV